MAPVIPEYMRVRKYLYSLVYASDGTDLRIPPENELTRMFGVSRVTVRGAIHGLVNDNILISRRGVGTFINPDALKREHKLPIIGLLYGNGRQVFQPMDSALLLAVRQCGMLTEPLYIPNSKAPERLLEIVRTNISAIIWNNPGNAELPYLRAIRNSGKPLLIFGKRFGDEFDAVIDTRTERGKILADHLVALGHRHVLYIHNYQSKNIDDPDSPDSTSGSFAKQLRQLTGEQFDGFLSLDEFEKRLDEEGIGHYTVIYSDAALVRPVTELLEKAGLRVPEDISYLTAWKPAEYFFHGMSPAYIDCSTNQTADVVEWLKRKIIDGDKEPFFRFPASIIRSGETLTPNRRKGN